MAKLENVHNKEVEKAEETTKDTVEQKPVFDEIEGMDQNTALSVLIQTAELAQKSGILQMRDSVILAKAISLFAPGKI